MTAMSSFGALITTSALHRDLGLTFPTGLRVRGDAARLAMVLRDDFLRERTAGPYSPDHLPTEALKFVNLHADITLAGHLPRFSLVTDPSGRWARIVVDLVGTRIRAVIVMPEEAPAALPNGINLGGWQQDVATHLSTVLSDLGHLLSACRQRDDGREPLIDLRLRYVPEPEHMTAPGALTERVEPPVRGLLTLRWLRATAAQRRALPDLVRGHWSAAADGATVSGRWPRRRLTARWTFGLSSIDVCVPLR
jgi:hypothetical protein